MKERWDAWIKIEIRGIVSSMKKKIDSDQKAKEQEKNSHMRKWIYVSSIVVCILAIILIYLGFSGYFANHFYGKTWINEIDCSYLTSNQTKQLLQEQMDQYELMIETREGEKYPVTGQQMCMKYTDDQQIDAILKKQKPLEWIFRFWSGGNYGIHVNFTYDKEALKQVVSEMDFMQPEYIVEPEDAYIDSSQGEYTIVAEKEGNKPDTDRFFERLFQGVENGTTEFSMEDNGCYCTPVIRKDDPQLGGEAKTLNDLTASNLTFSVAGESIVLDRNTLKEWLIQDENGAYLLAPEKISEFVDMLAEKRNSYGGTREFTTHDGKTITLGKNYYGWQVDRKETLEQLKTALAEGRQGEMELVYTRTAQGSGADDLGDVYVEISIDQQRMWCYKNGEVVVDTPIVSGNLSIPGRATPRNGCWTIYRKKKDHTMKGPIQPDGQPEYTAFCKYWMPFNKGVGIHDLASRRNFGGDIYIRSGSHGCINTPLDAVRKIYDTVSVGTPVIVY